MTSPIPTRTGGWPGSNPLRRASLFPLAGLGLLASACASAPDAPGGHSAAAPPALTQTDFDALPGWSSIDAGAAVISLSRSCERIEARSGDRPLSERVPHAGTAGDWRGVCRQARTLAADGAGSDRARAFFEDNFTPMRVAASGKLTGYYEPLVEVRRQRDPEFSMAIRAVPGGAFSGGITELIAGMESPASATARAQDMTLPRAEIERREIGAPLAWGRPIDVFFLQIQGSGRLVFDDGREIRAAFAAHNDQPYVSIGRILLDRGELAPGQASKAHIEDWLERRGPEAWEPLFNENPRYVFFQLQPIHDPEQGPNGAQGAPLTPMASLAVDPAHHAWGVPVFIEADIADQPNWSGLVIAQDAGGAITGPARGDLFYGWGDAAGERAGRQNAEARWHILLPKPVAARLARSS